MTMPYQGGPVERAVTDLLLAFPGGCDRENCGACEPNRRLARALVAAVREEERQDCELRLAGVPRSHLR